MEKIGDYLLLKKIAIGGMAEVYLAKNTLRADIEKFFAVKCLLPKYLCEKEYIELFTNEARVQVNMNHGNVVSIYDFGVRNLKFYIVMEYVNGATLHNLFRKSLQAEHALTISEIIYIIKESAQGLEHAHSCTNLQTGDPVEIIHGDISPDNIMLTVGGEVKIIDFGVSKFVGVERNLTAGKQKYMSLSQFEGKELTFKSDIYSLGRTFLELIRASMKYENFLSKDNHTDDLNELKNVLNSDVFRFLERMLIQESSDSFESMEEVVKELSLFLNTKYPGFNKKNLGKKLQKYSDKEFLEEHLEDITETTVEAFPEINSNLHADEKKRERSAGATVRKKKIRRRRRTVRKKAS